MKSNYPTGMVFEISQDLADEIGRVATWQLAILFAGGRINWTLD